MLSRHTPPYVIIPPNSAESCVVVEVPHAGLAMDAESLATLQATGRDLVRDADLFVDELCDEVVDHGATLLVSNMSRYYLDLNRHHDDHDGESVAGSRGHLAPHGVVWNRTTTRKPCLTQPLSTGELSRRLEKLYFPYHRYLEKVLWEKRDKFGVAVLICAHSMPSEGRNLRGEWTQRADLVPGTRGGTSTHQILASEVGKLAREGRFSVAFNDPYRGGFSTGNYGDPYQGVHAIQIEVSRHLYMDEQTFARKTEGIDRLRRYFNQLCASLPSLAQGLPDSGGLQTVSRPIRLRA